MKTLPDCERPISETFADVRNLMFSYCHKFQNKYGGHWDDWESLGHEVFMKAYTRYNPAKGKFSTWFAFFLQTQFTERIRRDAMRHARLKRVRAPDDDLDLIAAKDRCSEVSKMFRDLSADARMVVMLVLDTPNDIKLAVLEQKRNVGIRDRMLNGMMEFLRDLGWDDDRVFDSFEEVSSALC